MCPNNELLCEEIWLKVGHKADILNIFVSQVIPRPNYVPRYRARVAWTMLENIVLISIRITVLISTSFISLLSWRAHQRNYEVIRSEFKHSARAWISYVVNFSINLRAVYRNNLFPTSHESLHSRLGRLISPIRSTYVHLYVVSHLASMCGLKVPKLLLLDLTAF